MTSIRRQIKATIDQHGHAVINIPSTLSAPCVSYTVGLSPELGAELIMFAVPDAMTIINRIARDLRGGLKLPMKKPIMGNQWANYPLQFRKCKDGIAHKEAVQSANYYFNAPHFVQIVIPDAAGKFPEDAGFDHMYMDIRQPLLYTAGVEELWTAALLEEDYH